MPRPALAFLIASVLAIGFQALFPQIIDPDGYFHIRIAERLPRLDMPWMPYSVFADGWVDHQLLFHVVMAPFAHIFDDDVLGAKLFAALAAAGAYTAIGAFLDKQRVPLPYTLATLPFALSWTFLLRMGMPRTQSVALILLCAVLHALSERRVALLAALSFTFAWTYHVGAVVVPLACAFVLVDPKSRSQLRSAVLLPLGAALGFGGGLVIHPQSPETIRFIWQHVVLKVGNTQELPVGDEWRRGGLATLFGSGLPTLILCCFAIGLAVRAGSRAQALSRLVLAVAVVSHLLLLQGSKFIEYAAPFAAMALGLFVRDSAFSLEPLLRPARRWVLVTVLALWALSTALSTAARVRRNDPLPHRVEPAMQWLSAHATPGEVIYHFDWGDFPELVFHAPQLRYIVGLDPHFLALSRPDLWDLHDRIAKGGGRNPSKPIAERFGARWAVLVLPWEGARESLARDPAMVERFADSGAVVYEVRHPLSAPGDIGAAVR